MSLSFPLRSMADDPSMWDSETRRNRGTPRERWLVHSVLKPCEGLAVMVGATEIEGRLWGKLEANPARVDDPEGCSLLPLKRVEPVLSALWATVQDHVQPNCDLGDANLKRVDVARDFTVSSPAFFVRGLAPVHRPYAKRVGVWSDPQKGSAQTLHAGSGAGMVRLYDQWEAYAGKGAEKGALRWEVEARTEWLRRIAGMKNVVDLTEHRARKLAGDRWGWSAMGVEVGAVDLVVEKVMKAERDGLMTRREAERFLGWVLMESRGIARPVGKETAAKYRRWVRELGVTVAPDESDGAFVARLDWDSGGEVVRVA